MSLTHNDLYMVARAISCSQSHHRRRDSLRQTMLMSLQDFFRVRLSLLDMDFDGLSDPRAITIANHFESRYGSSVASAIRTLHPPQNFRDQHVLILCDVRLWPPASAERYGLTLSVSASPLFEASLQLTVCTCVVIGACEAFAMSYTTVIFLGSISLFPSFFFHLALWFAVHGLS